MHFDFFYFIKNNIFVILALIGVAGLYFFLNTVFGGEKKKPKDEDDEDDEDEIKLREPKKTEQQEENKHKIKKGYTVHSSSYMSSARHYDFIPKDGSAVRRNEYNTKRTIKNTKTNKEEKAKKEQIFAEIFYTKMIESLSQAARYAKTSNEQFEKDFKMFKKDGKFSDVSIDFVEDKIKYTNDVLDRSEQILYTEDIEDGANADKSLITFDNGMATHKCPFCGTENIIDTKTKKYNCFYCLKEVSLK